MAKKKLKNKQAPRTDTPVYDQLVDDLGFAPHHQPDGWRNMPGIAGLLEDNFS